MLGRRLLDAATLFGAARSIAVQHAKIRAQQFDIYAKTSSISKAVNSNSRQSRGSAYGTKSTSSDAPSPAKDPNAAIPESQNIQGDASQDKTQDILQDHHYTRSTENSPTDPAPNESLDVQQKQAERYPFEDGSIPQKDAPITRDEQNDEAQPLRRHRGEHLHILGEGGRSSKSSLKPRSSREPSILEPAERSTRPTVVGEDARISQRQSEAQIPSQPAEPPSRADLTPADESEQDQPEIFVDQERDTYYQPPHKTSPVLSALPRVKLPKHYGEEQGGDSRLPEQLNADTYYSSAEHEQESNKSGKELPENMLSSIFQSPRVKKLLSSSGKTGYAPGGVGPKGTQSLHTFSRSQAKATFTTSSRQAQRSSAAKGEEDVKDLAADIAKDVDIVSKQVRIFGSACLETDTDRLTEPT